MADLSKIKLNGTTYNFKDTAARTAIGNMTSFNVEIISNFPTGSNIDTHTIYFKSNGGSNGNSYDEYMYIGSAWEKIGTTDIDLSGYAQTSSLATVATSGSYNDLTNKPTIPAATTVTQTLTSGTAIGSVNSTTLYAPTPYNDTALAARVTALENIPWVTYYSGTSTPNSAQGNNGDIYLQTQA